MTDALTDLRLPAGEHVLWSGRPDPGKVFTRNDLFVVPFSLLWVGFAIFWTVNVRASNAPGFFVIWGLAFVAVGLYFVVGRFFAKAVLKRTTVYVLTNRSAIVRRGGSEKAVTLPAPSTSTHLTSDGRHLDVVFSTGTTRVWGNQWAARLYMNTGMDVFVRRTGDLGFFDVTDVQGLQSALRLAASKTQ
jgi:hypothetical protein